jgi:hypothetical protein
MKTFFGGLGNLVHSDILSTLPKPAGFVAADFNYKTR